MVQSTGLLADIMSQLQKQKNLIKADSIRASKSPMKSIFLLSLIATATIIVSSADSGFCTEQMDASSTTLGGIQQSRGAENSLEIDALGRFAVEEHNKRENAMLEFGRVVKAKEQVVAGTLHHLTLEIIEAGKKKLYEAKVWVKPWMNFKELQDFKHAGDCDGPSFTYSDLGVKKDGHGPGWRAVPINDPVVQDAANHALKTIQQRSNSLLPYELQEIVHANAEVVEDLPKFDMLLKLKRGDKEEKFKVEVHQKSEGSFHLNQMEPDHS